jgi:hypothetical protein
VLRVAYVGFVFRSLRVRSTHHQERKQLYVQHLVFVT